MHDLRMLLVLIVFKHQVTTVSRKLLYTTFETDVLLFKIIQRRYRRRLWRGFRFPQLLEMNLVGHAIKVKCRITLVRFLDVPDALCYAVDCFICKQVGFITTATTKNLD